MIPTQSTVSGCASAALTFVVATNDYATLKCNLLASPCLQDPHPHQLIVQERYVSASRAYNAAMERAVNDIVVFIHHDVFLPEGWLHELFSALRALEHDDPRWGVLGCCGIASDCTRFGYLYTPGEGLIGCRLQRPQEVRVLDEVVLVLRKSAGLTFSDDLPDFHFYGPDICLRAAEENLHCYAMSAFCIHNSRQYFEYPPEFYDCYRYMKRKWQSALPIQTSCICVSRFDEDIWKWRIKKALSLAIGRNLERGPRLKDPQLLWNQIQAAGRV